jgi:glycosyltransferase involved in cell wall biosynthesis
MIILVGSEDRQRLRSIKREEAPRLDYYLVANRLDGQIRSCFPSPANLRGARLVRGYRSFSNNLRIACEILSSDSNKTIYSTGETWGLPLALAGKLRRVEGIAHIVYAHRVYGLGWQSFLRYFSRLLHVQGWITVNQVQADLLRNRLRCNSVKVEAISQGVDTIFYNVEKAKPEKTGCILSVGTEMRNYSLLLDAVRSLDVTTIIQASSSWMQGTREILPAMPDKVVVQTKRLSYPKLRNLYAGASIVVVPLHDTYQAAGITTILEAMAMGRCVIATRSKGLPDVLQDEVTGVIVEPTAEDLSQAIRSLLADSEKARHLGENASKLVRETVSLESHASQVASFIRKAAGRYVGSD